LAASASHHQHQSVFLLVVESAPAGNHLFKHVHRRYATNDIQRQRIDLHQDQRVGQRLASARENFLFVPFAVDLDEIGGGQPVRARQSSNRSMFTSVSPVALLCDPANIAPWAIRVTTLASPSPIG